MLIRKRLWWLVAFIGAWVAVAASAETHERQYCSIEEPWGESRYVLDPVGEIEHQVRAQGDRRFQLARVIPGTHAASLCVALDRGLVFVVEGEGIYQLERQIEGNGDRVWLMDVPLHFSASSYFSKTDQGLTIHSGSLSTAIIFDTTVRNDSVPELSAAAEAAFNGVDILGSLGLGQTAIVQILDGQFSVQFEELSVPLGEAAVIGHCSGVSNAVSFDHEGRLFRYRFEREKKTIERDGMFQLPSRVAQCQIDSHSERLYVVTGGSVIWVFDLRQSGLGMPRAVTTDRVVESLNGITLYGEEYVITQSVGDGAFLIFETGGMRLLAHFRVVADVSNGIDGVHWSGGFEAVSRPIDNMHLGLLAIRDSQNRLPDDSENLKLIDWRLIQRLIDTTQSSKGNE